MSKEDLLRKLTSKKIWSLIIGLAIAVCTLFKVDAGTTESIVASIAAFGMIAVYIGCETMIDITRINNVDKQ